MEKQKAIRLGLTNISISKPPVAEFDRDSNLWRIWTSYNRDLSKGTYTILHNDGKMERVTIHPDDSISIAIIT